MDINLFENIENFFPGGFWRIHWGTETGVYGKSTIMYGVNMTSINVSSSSLGLLNLKRLTAFFQHESRRSFQRPHYLLVMLNIDTEIFSTKLWKL